MSQDIKINKLLEKYNLNKDEIDKIYEVNENLDLVLEEDFETLGITKEEEKEL